MATKVDNFQKDIMKYLIDYVEDIEYDVVNEDRKSVV